MLCCLKRMLTNDNIVTREGGGQHHWLDTPAQYWRQLLPVICPVSLHIKHNNCQPERDSRANKDLTCCGFVIRVGLGWLALCSRYNLVITHYYATTEGWETSALWPWLAVISDWSLSYPGIFPSLFNLSWETLRNQLRENIEQILEFHIHIFTPQFTVYSTQQGARCV